MAGVAWRPSGSGHALVVLARGQGAGQMRSSLATLNVFHGGRNFPVTAPVTVAVGEGDADSSRQTLRFMFRLPASAPSWPIERMVLRWKGTEVELPPPAHPPAGVPEPDSELFGPSARAAGLDDLNDPARGVERIVRTETTGQDGGGKAEFEEMEEPMGAQRAADEVPSEPGSRRYGPEIAEAERTLALLHDEIVQAKLELAQLHAEIAQARLQYEEASMAREYAERERDAAQKWLLDVTGELEDVERQLGECRVELDQVTRGLAARRAELEEREASAAPPSTPPREGDEYSRVGRDLNAALTELRSKLDQVLSQPLPDAPVQNEPVGHAPIGQAPGPEAPDEHPEEAAFDTAPVEAALVDGSDASEGSQLSGPAPVEEPGPRAPASLPGRIDREEGESSWFAAALRRLAEEDREAAGRVLVSVLPAQAIATPRSFHYDLVVRDDAVYAVDAHPLDARVQRLEVPRPMDQTEAWIIGTLEQLGDLILRGKSSFLRLFNRHGLKVKGQRARLDDLLALARAPLRLRDLCAVGAPIQPQLLLQMIASSIDPGWIEAVPLAIRFDPLEEDMRVCSFRIRDGAPVVMGTESTAAADFGELTTIAEGSTRSLMRLLAGLPSPEGDQANIRGPVEPLELLQSWVRRLELSSL